MNLTEAFEQNIVGIPELYEEKVETVISTIFLYKDRVYKIYKHENGFVGDLTDSAFRKSFYQEDFFWNQRMSPEIYLELVGFKDNGGNWTRCDLEKAQDFAIEMNRVNVKNNLHHYLIDGKATDKILREIADTMMQRLANLTKEKRASIKTFQRSWKELSALRLNDEKEWGYVAAEKGMSKQRTDFIIGSVAKAWEDPYINGFDKSKYVVAIDNHAGNILIADKGIEFMDIYQFREHWLAADPLVLIARPALDIIVLGGEKEGEIFLDQCSKYYQLPSEKIVSSYLVYAGLIMEAYHYMLGNPKLAKKYAVRIDKELALIA